MPSFGSNHSEDSAPPTPPSFSTPPNDVAPSSSSFPSATTPKHTHSEHTLPDGTRVIQDERTWGGDDGAGASGKGWGKVVVKRWERPSGATNETQGASEARAGIDGSGNKEEAHPSRDVRLNHINDALFSRFLRQPPHDSDSTRTNDDTPRHPLEDFFSDAFFPAPLPSVGRLVFPEEEDHPLLIPQGPQASTPTPHHDSYTTPSGNQVKTWSYSSSGSLSGWSLVAGLVAVGAGVWGWKGRKRVRALEQRVRDLTHGSETLPRASLARSAQVDASSTPAPTTPSSSTAFPNAPSTEIDALHRRVEELERALEKMKSQAGIVEKTEGGRVLDELRKKMEEKRE
ncbi:hypothetical protein IAR50_006638 [Cryptococcus sp. DSM 104548]